MSDPVVPQAATEVHALSGDYPEPWRTLSRRYKTRQPKENQRYRDCYDLDRIAWDLMRFIKTYGDLES